MSSAPHPQSASPDQRHDLRTHLFVIATLCSNVGSAPVHIRNMSLRGAQIEAPVVPDIGDSVVLKRGALQIGGRIAWKADRKAGIAFNATANVADWMIRHSGAHQEKVDKIILAVRGSADVPGACAAEQGAVPDADMIEAELALLYVELRQLGNTLASDLILVANHPEIQVLDISLQRVDRIRNALNGLYG